MKLFILVAAFMGFMANAEVKTCTVKGMHCQGCAEGVEGKVCDESKYSTCAVTILDVKKEIGQVHFVTKDDKAKLDEKGLAAILEDAGYKLDKCSTGAPKAAKAKKT